MPGDSIDQWEAVDLLNALWRSHRGESGVRFRVLGGGKDEAVASKLVVDPSMITWI